MPQVSVVVLSKFPDIFQGFRESVEKDAPVLQKVVVWDSDGDCYGVHFSQYPEWGHTSTGEPFQIAANANYGWKSINQLHDVLYAGDDTRIIEPNTIERLREVAYSDEKIGIVAARQRGQAYKHLLPEFAEQPFVPFVFVFIKRAAIDAIGYLDERFEGYGCDDVDYSVRARQAGFKVGVAGKVIIQHGVDGHPHMSTFRRVKTEKQIADEDFANWKRFAEKYGLPNDRAKIWNFIRTLKGEGTNGNT